MGRHDRTSFSLSQMSKLKPRRSARRSPAEVHGGSAAPVSGREKPLWVLEPSAACLPAPPLSAWLGPVGPYRVPMSLSSNSLTSSTWRKTGSWALPGIGTHPSSVLGMRILQWWGLWGQDMGQGVGQGLRRPSQSGLGLTALPKGLAQ